MKKIESHPHRRALQADLQQNNAYNPLSEKSKKMIKDMGNKELFELCETIPKVQCSECLLYWNQGIVYCTPTMRGGDAPKRHLREFTIASNEIQHIVIRSSKLAGLRRRAIAMDKLAQENHSCCPLPESSKDVGKLVCHTEQIRKKCLDETPIRLPRSNYKCASSPP